MTEETQEKRPRRKLLIMAVSIATILAMALPMIVMAQDNGPIDMDGTYYVFRAPRSINDVDGEKHTPPYPAYGLYITGQNEEVVTGLLVGLNVTRIRGGLATAGTTTIEARRSRVRLGEGETEFEVAGNGTINVYLPDGVVGTALSANATLEGEPVTLAPGDNTLTFTGGGDVTVYLESDSEILAEVAGIIGSGRRAQFMAAGTRVTTFIDDSGDLTATIDGLTLADGLHRVAPPGGAWVVSGAGTFEVYMPHGCYGTVTGSGGLTIDGEEAQDLVPGEWTEFDTGITTGNLHINVSTTMTFQLNASVRSRSGEITGLRGRLEGLIVLERSPWNAAAVSMRAHARAQTWCIGD